LIRKRLLSILILLLLTFNILVVLNLNTIRISAAEYPAVYIEPATTVDPTLTLGSTYTVSVKTDYTGDDINSWQFTLGYNPSVLKIGINGLNYTDIWAGTGTKKSFEATGKLIVPDSEDVYVGGILKTKGVDYTIDYQTGMITFTTAPAKGVEVKATYLYCLINGDLITKAINPNAMFNPGTADNVAGKLTLTGAFFFYIFPPAPLTSGPGTLANVTFTVVGIGEADITLGPETKLIGITEGGMGDPYSIVDGGTMPEHLGHGYFNNVKPIHDVAVVSIDAPAQANIGEIVPIDVTITNEGDFTETFDVTVYANTAEIGTQSVTNLGVGTQTTLNFIWNTAGVSPGTYTINATATIALDDDPSDNFKTTPIVLLAPPPPVADANGPYSGSEGTPITFDASGSTPNGGVIVLYEWDWNNDGTYDESTTSPFIDHTWLDDYAGTVGLRVTDSEELSDTATASVTVYNVAPTVNAGPDQAVNEGDLVSFVGSFTDPGLDTHTIFWDFGDDSNATGTLTPTHIYTKTGVYTVTLNITDDDGGSGTDTLTVTVSAVAVHDIAVISVVPSTYEVLVGNSVLIRVTVVNQGNQPESFTVKAYANTNLIGSTSGSLGPGEIETYIISWITTTSGSFVIKGEVPPVADETDTTDNVLADGTVEVLPIPVTPVALFSEDPETPRVNEVVTFDASASYDPDGYIVGWSWDFGDGNSASGELVSHIYLVAGDYNVTLTVTDDDGLADTAWHIKTVLPLATGTLTVTTTPVSGEVFVNGTSWGLAPQSRVVLVGTYNVSFGGVAGYYTPDWRLATVSENVETVVEGIYKPITGALNATVDLDPDTLNLKSEGRWITCYIRLPEGYDVGDINVSTILLDGVVPAEWGNVEGNVLMVKFDRQAVIEYIRDVLEIADGEVTLTVTGKLYDETMFEGSDTIRVICRGRRE